MVVITKSNTIAKTVNGVSGMDVSLDEVSKALLQITDIMALLLQCTVPEFAELSVPDIAKRIRKSNPQANAGR